jgi:hypothetical protein
MNVKLNQLRCDQQEARANVIQAAQFWQRNKNSYGLEIVAEDDLSIAINRLEKIENELLDELIVDKETNDRINKFED